MPRAHLASTDQRQAKEPRTPAREEHEVLVRACTRGATATPLSSPYAPTTPLPAPLRHGQCRSRPAPPPPPPPAASGAAAAKATATTDDDFEERVMRIKSRVGPEKRVSAAARKRKAAAESKAITLPPVPLREPRSAVGVPVEFGFTAYSERFNGALAAVGLAALLQVLVKYHQPATLFRQVYTIAAAGAVFKYEKERISVWPGPAATKPLASGE